MLWNTHIEMYISTMSFVYAVPAYFRKTAASEEKTASIAHPDIFTNIVILRNYLRYQHLSAYHVIFSSCFLEGFVRELCTSKEYFQAD